MTPYGPVCRCGVREHLASPGCAEHARRDAESVHFYARVQGSACPAGCVVCAEAKARPAARRGGRRGRS